ncbi:influenza virus NS1A-binding protein homolog [Paramacrobiotus metropolitanus]|uniref:influenza virus NS1A-binding protein homolog n=1 Tax=Paramacrobiotus metropolitanus TaxID=2943436 RepID=UPI0024465B75|nr:influenza virus NS1A-binding protein homolog [Paramacrobiotus metropolitanus]
MWEYVASLPTPLEKCTVVSLVPAGVRVRRLHVECSYYYQLGIFYDPTSNVWHELPPMPTARYCPSACVGSDGWIYVIGGYGSQGSVGCVEAFNPTTKQWLKKCDIGRLLYGVGTCCMSDKIFVLGGIERTEGENTVDVYDILLDTWTPSDSQLPNGPSVIL